METASKTEGAHNSQVAIVFRKSNGQTRVAVGELVPSKYPHLILLKESPMTASPGHEWTHVPLDGILEFVPLAIFLRRPMHLLAPLMEFSGANQG